MDEQAIRGILDSGLDEVYVGIDAVDEETYAQIRRGGDYKTVLRNVHRLIELAQGRVEITVQFGVYENNENQVEEFQRYWSKYPVKIFIRPKLTWCGFLEDKVKSPAPRHACPWIFDSINVNEDGQVPYCVTDWVNRHPLGNAAGESLFTIWQEKTYPFLVYHARQDWEKLPQFCRDCRDWQTKPPRDPALLALFAQAQDVS
jgi:hypothetical protein